MRSIWRLVQEQYRQDRRAFGVGVLVSLVPAAAGILLLGVSGWFITTAAVAGLTGAFLNIFAPSAIIRALAILRTAGRYGERVLTHEATFRFLTRLRDRLFSGFSASRRRGERSGRLLNRLTLDIAALDTVYLRLVVPAATAGLLAIALLVWLATVTAPVLAVGAVFLGTWTVLLVVAATRADRQAARRADAALEAMRLRSADLVAGRRDLAIYGGLEEATRSVLQAQERLVEAETAEERRTVKLVALSGLTGQLFLAATLAVAVAGSASGAFGPAFAAGLVLVVMALPETAGQLLPGLARLPRIALAARRTRGLMFETADATEDPSPARSAPAPGGKTAMLRLEQVRFRYPGAERAVLENLTFEIGVGEVVAITGRSGCGKSTIAGVASRMLSPEAGRVLLKGQDLAGLPEATLRNTVCVLGQRPHLFNDTVSANLRIARPEAGEGELWTALERAALANRIRNGPMGLETVLGEGGLGLSGGEQRRLALARAFLTRADLFILDEMTEGLDRALAGEVLDRFFAFRGQASVLMITHKRCEVQRADRVLDLPELPGMGASQVAGAR